MNKTKKPKRNPRDGKFIKIATASEQTIDSILDNGLSEPKIKDLLKRFAEVTRDNYGARNTASDLMLHAHNFIDYYSDGKVFSAYDFAVVPTALAIPNNVTELFFSELMDFLDEHNKVKVTVPSEGIYDSPIYQLQK